MFEDQEHFCPTLDRDLELTPTKPLITKPLSPEEWEREGIVYTRLHLQQLREQLIENPELINKTKYFAEMVSPKKKPIYRKRPDSTCWFITKLVVQIVFLMVLCWIALMLYYGVRAMYFEDITLATQLGFTDTVDRLISTGRYDMNQRDEYGNSLLHHAVNFNRIGVVNLLVKKLADLTPVNANGDTILHNIKSFAALRAIYESHKEKILKFVVAQKNKQQQTPLMKLMLRWKNDLYNSDLLNAINLLISMIDPKDLVNDVIGDMDPLRMCIDLYRKTVLVPRGGLFKTKQIDPDNAYTVCESLVESKGVELNRRYSDLEDGNLVHYIVKNDDPKLRSADITLLKLLKEHGANFNWKDADGRTPLFFVKSQEMTEFLVSNGASVNEVDTGGVGVLGYHLHLFAFLAKPAGSRKRSDEVKIDDKLDVIRTLKLTYNAQLTSRDKETLREVLFHKDSQAMANIDDHLDALLKFVFQEKYVPVLRYFPFGTITHDEITSDSFLKFYKNITDTVLFLDMERVEKDSKVCGTITSSDRVKAWIGGSIPSTKDNLQFVTTRSRTKNNGKAVFELPKEVFDQYAKGSKYAYIAVASESSWVARAWIEKPPFDSKPSEEEELQNVSESTFSQEQPINEKDTIRVEISTQAQTTLRP